MVGILKDSKKIPKNFKKEYMRYYNKEITRENLYEEFNVCSTTIKIWVNTLGLPKADKLRGPKGPRISIPENFKSEYMKYYRGKLPFEELCAQFNVSPTTGSRWRDKLNLPKAIISLQKDYEACCNHRMSMREFQKKYAISRETLKKWEEEDNFYPHDFITFRLFGYEISIRSFLKITKISRGDIGTSSNNLNDFIEY